MILVVLPQNVYTCTLLNLARCTIQTLDGSKREVTYMYMHCIEVLGTVISLREDEGRFVAICTYIMNYIQQFLTVGICLNNICYYKDKRICYDFMSFILFTLFTERRIPHFLKLQSKSESEGG
jgi:hypothetical protein